jgi:NADH-quinone oxidoreductase subunit K
MPILLPLLLSAALFGIGLYGVLARRNAVLALIGVELMLNAVTLQLVAYDVGLAGDDSARTGQTLALFVIALAAAEIGLGLAIVLALFRARGTIDVDDVDPIRAGDAA